MRICRERNLIFCLVKILKVVGLSLSKKMEKVVGLSLSKMEKVVVGITIWVNWGEV